MKWRIAPTTLIIMHILLIECTMILMSWLRTQNFENIMILQIMNMILRHFLFFRIKPNISNFENFWQIQQTKGIGKQFYIAGDFGFCRQNLINFQVELVARNFLKCLKKVITMLNFWIIIVSLKKMIWWADYLYEFAMMQITNLKFKLVIRFFLKTIYSLVKIIVIGGKFLGRFSKLLEF